MDELYLKVYPERAFGGFSRCDGTVEFFTRIQALLLEVDTVLDIGCGRGVAAEDKNVYRRNLRDLRGDGRKVIGIDVDKGAAVNPDLDEFRFIETVDHWPVEDNSISLAMATAVMEHVADPASFFREAYRVLKPGGYLCLRTFNKWHYVGIAARLIPNRFHASVTSKVQVTRKEEDVFHTYYRCNTRGQLRRALQSNGFDCFVYSYEAEPSYLRFSNLLFRTGAAVHKLLPPSLRWTLLAYARKRADE